ncbi:MAG: histidine kinase [Bacteroidia bacterium]|nr:histidine kinase [Bacteroidia bacterium]
MYFQTQSTSQQLTFILLFETIVILLIWGINLVLIKAFENTSKKFIRYVVSIVFVILLAYVISKCIDIKKYIMHPMSVNDKPLPPMKGLMPFPFISMFFNNLFVLFIIDIIVSKNREKIVENENAILRIKNLEAQQIQLRQQIQPHFLFNSLNTLKSLISNHPTEAEEYLVKLSSFLRYNLSSNDQDLILLVDELKICREYLEIQKVRFKEALKYSIDIDEQKVSTSQIPIFAIQVLLENAIKHNTLTAENPLIIHISLINDNKIKVSNNLQERKKQDIESTQIGLKNLQERYALLDKKQIVISKTTNKFEVILSLV